LGQGHGFARGNTHMKYESSTNQQSEVMIKVKVFEKVKVQGQRSECQGHDIKRKFLPERIQ
jgi:hypothetical protein